MCASAAKKEAAFHSSDKAACMRCFPSWVAGGGEPAFYFSSKSLKNSVLSSEVPISILRSPSCTRETYPTHHPTTVWILGGVLSLEGVILASEVSLGKWSLSLHPCQCSSWPQDVTVEDGLGAVWLRTIAPAAGKLSLLGLLWAPLWAPTIQVSWLTFPQSQAQPLLLQT